MEIKLTINGKEVALTNKQLEALGIENTEKNPVERVAKDKWYYYISTSGHVKQDNDIYSDSNTDRYNVANYCTDETLIKQRALHETLNRLLWRASIQAGEENNAWGGYNTHWFIYYDRRNHDYKFGSNNYVTSMNIYFPTLKSAEDAIKNIVEPFIKQHPDFVW